MSKKKKEMKRRPNGSGTGFIWDDNKNIGYRSVKVPYQSRPKKFYGKTVDIVNRKIQEDLQDYYSGKKSVTSNSTIIDVIKMITDYKKKNNSIKGGTYRRIGDTIKVIERYPISKMRIERITPNDIVNFGGYLARDYSNSVIDKVWFPLQDAFKIAREEGYISDNPMEHSMVSKPKSFKKDRKVVAFDTEEQKQFLKALENYKPQKNGVNYANMLYIAIFCGCRMGEICALRIEDINLDKKTIHIERTVIRDENYKTVIGETTKTKNGVRTISYPAFFHDKMVEIVEDYKENPEHLLFIKKDGSIISTGNVNSSFTTICKNNNIRHQGVHMLRHTFATRLIEAHVPPEIIKDLLGDTFRSVIDTYCDVFEKHTDKGVAMYNEYMQNLFDKD